MPKSIAFLRAVNVGGVSLKMAALRATLMEYGFKDVQTYLQSGNVVFNSSAKNQTSAQKMTDAIASAFGLEVWVTVKTAQEVARVVEGNPFAKQKKYDPSRFYVSLLSESVNGREAALEKYRTGEELFCIDSDCVYLYCPRGYGTSKLNNPNLERAFKCKATTRNWKTMNAVLKLVKMC